MALHRRPGGRGRGVRRPVPDEPAESVGCALPGADARSAPAASARIRCEASFSTSARPPTTSRRRCDWRWPTAAEAPPAQPPVLLGARARIDASARLDATILWDDVEVGAEARLTECIVADGVACPAGVSTGPRRAVVPAAACPPAPGDDRHRRPAAVADRSLASTMSLNAHPAAVPVPEPVSAYLARRGLDAQKTRVVPLTGDASDRRYFRVIEADGTTSVLALYAAPFDYDTLSFVNVARAAPAGAAARAGDLRPRRRSRPPAAAGPRRRDDAGAPRRGVAGRARRALPPGGQLPRRAPAARRRARVAEVRPVLAGVRRREADVGTRVLREALHRGLQGRPGAGRRRARRSARSGRRSSRNWRPSRACSATATTTAAT